MTPEARLAEAFARGRAEGRALLMPYLVAGFPDGDTFVEAAAAAAEAGADVLEIGIPFSDPIMDGPVIQEATTAVLARGQRTGEALELVARATEAARIPAVAMTYYNIPFRRGLRSFARELAERGACGAILPDLSVEDAGPWLDACHDTGIAPVFIAAQTSSGERLRAIARAGRGFVYAASLLGVTGVRETLSTRAQSLVEAIRRESELPVALGIGVSTAEHAREAARFADGVIVGTAIVKRLAESAEPVDAVRSFVKELRAACAR